ncbi:MAG: FAD-dependent oxidoreductase [candidate division SR1 bacterium]|nr:FAD-dependent oxidoreductase [candidate division SR1 bacterium]
MDQGGIKAKVINRQMLTDTIIELTIETYQEVKVVPGQSALFLLEDDQGTFERYYSIVDQDTDNERTMLIFAIKLSTNGRGTTAIKNIHIGNEVMIKGIFGNFILQDTQLPKVFIGTGIGIVPLINMAKYCMTEKQLFFSVSTQQDLFYEERIKKIHGLGYEIHISQESIPGYAPGRIDITKTYFDPATEFYVCGKPEIIDNIIENLTFLGFKRIYSEKF